MDKILGFNHINADNDHIPALKELYYHYHKLQWCYHKKHKTYKRYSFIIDSLSAGILAISTSTAITINPLTSIISLLSLATTYIKKKKKWAEKSSKYKEVTILINRILADLRSYLRDETCDMTNIKKDLKALDKKILNIIEIPNIDKYIETYNKKFVINVKKLYQESEMK